MIDDVISPDVIGAWLGGSIGGWLVGAKRKVKRMPVWRDMRLMKLTGERPESYIETRDTGRSSLLTRLVFGSDYRYIVRTHKDGEVVEDLRYRHAHDALEYHAEAAKALAAGEAL